MKLTVQITTSGMRGITMPTVKIDAEEHEFYTAIDAAERLLLALGVESADPAVGEEEPTEVHEGENQTDGDSQFGATDDTGWWQTYQILSQRLPHDVAVKTTWTLRENGLI